MDINVFKMGLILKILSFRLINDYKGNSGLAMENSPHCGLRSLIYYKWSLSEPYSRHLKQNCSCGMKIWYALSLEVSRGCNHNSASLIVFLNVDFTSDYNDIRGLTLKEYSEREWHRISKRNILLSCRCLTSLMLGHTFKACQDVMVVDGRRSQESLCLRGIYVTAFTSQELHTLQSLTLGIWTVIPALWDVPKNVA